MGPGEKESGTNHYWFVRSALQLSKDIENDDIPHDIDQGGRGEIEGGSDHAVDRCGRVNTAISMLKPS